jgi:hypothetical protein
VRERSVSRRCTPPPQQYAGPYRGELTVHVVPIHVVDAKCRELAVTHGARVPHPPRPGLKQRGCSLGFDRASPEAPAPRCTIIIPKIGSRPDVTAALHDAVRRHELGHCNGWKH